MPRRWLVALALAAGCGSAGGPTTGGTDGRDGAADHADAAADVDDVSPPRADASGAGGGDAASDASDADGAGARDANDASDADGRGPGDVAPDVLPAFCPGTIPVITPSSGTVAGTFKGPSINPAVSCRGGVVTQGPEAFFTLKVDAPLTIDLVVAAPVDTLISIRSGVCSAGISEIACGEDPPVVDVDAGPPPLPSGSDGGTSQRFTGLRVPLAVGTYTIVVDTYTLGPLASADFTMTLGRVTPLPNATCANPTVLTAGTTVSGESLDRGGVPTSLCGASSRSVLYYAVGVPGGQRLTARATPSGGDRTWMPTIQAFASCATNGCLAQGHLAAGATQQLDWINNGTAWQLVFLAVGADAQVSGATFDLQVNVLDLFATCSKPVLVKDGTTLLGQDLSIAAPPATTTCSGVSDHAYYYAATLLPLQQITVNTTPSLGGGTFKVPANVDIRTACDSTALCMGSGDNATFMNQTNADATVIVEVTPFQQGQGGLFDLTVTIPDPPAKILVSPSTGLVTSESGGTATFSVLITAPPTADVTIALASDTPSEGTVTPASLTFTAASWRTAQTVTVKGVDDTVSDGAQEYTIVTSPAVSTDARYSGLDPDDVAVTNLDNDPGITLTGAGDVVTSEAGTTSTFSVSLNGAPTASVTMGLSSSDVGEGTVSPAQLTFTTTNWNVPQTVTVTGVDDAIVDGAQSFTIVTGTLASADGRYAGLNPPDVVAHNLDDDQAAVAVKLVSGAQTCGISGSLPIAVDRADTIYIVMACEGGLWVTTSPDAGLTFTDPALIPGTDNTNGQAFIAGGPAGFLYVVSETNDSQAMFLRTTDGGTTWSTPVSLASQTDVLRLRAAGKTVMVLSPGTDGTNMRLSRSSDGGRTFLPPAFPTPMDIDLGVEPGGQTAWFVSLDGTGDLRKSTDAGATFTKTGSIAAGAGDSRWVGLTHLFAISNSSLLVTAFSDPATTVTSTFSVNAPPFSMVSDELDQLTILDTDPQTSHLRATRVGAGSTTPAGPKLLGPSAGAAGVAPLSRNATAVAFLSGNVVLYSTVVWP
jgi:hypothetical protein